MSFPYYMNVQNPAMAQLFNSIYSLYHVKIFESFTVKDFNQKLFLKLFKDNNFKLKLKHKDSECYTFENSGNYITVWFNSYTNGINTWASNEQIFEKSKSIFSSVTQIFESRSELKIDFLCKSTDGSLSVISSICNNDSVKALDNRLFELAGVNVKKLAKTFYDSNETLLLLFGEPGIGKSKLSLKIVYSILQDLKKDVKMFIIKSQDVLEKLDTVTDIFYNYSKQNMKIFIFDDIDYTSLKRGYSPDVTKFVNFILSITDGAVPQYNKFIMTTNQSIDEIDEALLRPGRLFATLNLQAVKYEDLKTYDPKVAEICKNSYDKEDFTLAEINHVKSTIKNNLNTDFITRSNVLISKNKLRNTFKRESKKVGLV